MHESLSSSIKGHSMLSFEFSVFDLVLSIAVIVLIILYITTLRRLNPSNENEPSHEEEMFEETPEPAVPYPTQPIPQDQQQQPLQQTPPISTWQSQQVATRIQKPQQRSRLIVNATIDNGSEQSFEQVPLPPRLSKQISRRSVPEPEAISPLSHKSSEEKECPHQFGYLKSLPKNTQVPEECFGCQRIVECILNKKGKQNTV
jgi:hypothetical protein